MIDAKNAVEDAFVEFANDLQVVKTELIGQEAQGNCVTENDDMIGLFDGTGFPDPLVYTVCNLLSNALAFPTPFDACPIQPRFNGVALALTDNALEFDIAQKTDGELKFFDGFAEYEFAPQGEIFAGFGIGFPIPGTTSQRIASSVLAGGTLDFKKALESLVSSKGGLDIEGSLFLNLGDGEKTMVLSVGRLGFTPPNQLNILEFGAGSGFAVIRQDTVQPDCQPNGLFMTAEFSLQLGGVLQPILSLVPTVQSNFGVVTNPDGDELEAIFLRFSTESIFLGIPLAETSFEFQYFSASEFTRRQNFDENFCCNLDSVADPSCCGIAKSPINDFIAEASAQPTIALSANLERTRLWEKPVHLVQLTDLRFFACCSTAEKTQTNLIRTEIICYIELLKKGVQTM